MKSPLTAPENPMSSPVLTGHELPVFLCHGGWGRLCRKRTTLFASPGTLHDQFLKVGIGKGGCGNLQIQLFGNGQEIGFDLSNFRKSDGWVNGRMTRPEMFVQFTLQIRGSGILDHGALKCPYRKLSLAHECNIVPCSVHSSYHIAGQRDHCSVLSCL